MAISLFADTIQKELTHPITKEPTGLVLELVGQDSDDVYQAQIDVIKALRKKGFSEPVDIALSLDTKIKIATACISSWTIKPEALESWTAVFKKLGFDDAAYSLEKAKALIEMKTAGWIRTQIDEAIGDRERFFKDALTS
jgi:hypothetical protein